MDQTTNRKPRGANNKSKGKGVKNGCQGGGKQVQGKGKARKKGRAKAQAISGFSTLSQVSGAPLAHSHHSSIPLMPQKTVIEPLDNCCICGEKIQTIADCFSLATGYAHFDCVLERIKSEEHLSDDETISYIGSGSFAVCRKGEDGKFTIVKKIEVENKDSYNGFKNYVESLKQ